MTNSTETISVTTSVEMREKLLNHSSGVAGLIWYVGSNPDANYLESMFETFNETGNLSLMHGPEQIEALTTYPLHQPEIGIEFDSEKERLMITQDISAVQSLISLGETRDFHPDAFPAWKAVQDYFALYPEDKNRIRLMKTGFPTLEDVEGVRQKCLPQVQPEDVEQLFYYLVNGHIERCSNLSDVVIVSLDFPSRLNPGILAENFELYFSDEFDEEGICKRGNQVLRAIHACGGNWQSGEVIASNAVDLIHWDAWKYPEMFRHCDNLEGYLRNGGMIGWGGVPQNYDNLRELAEAIKGEEFHIRSLQDYDRLAEYLNQPNNFQTTADYIWGRLYDGDNSFLGNLARETGVPEKRIARQTFVSATCGLRTNEHEQLRNFHHKLTEQTALKLKNISEE